MSNTVPTHVKPSGPPVLPSAGMLPGIPAQPSEPVPYELTDAALQALATPRTLTYPLHAGGFLSLPCPTWCTFDHTTDVQHGIHPVDLYHAGDEISLSFTTAGDDRDVILSARIEQYPFGSEDGSDVPYMALMPVAGSGEILGHQSAAQVNESIHRVEKHLNALRKLSDKLATACATAHEERNTSLGDLGNSLGGRGWMSLRADDVKTMPLTYLLRAFEAVVVEVDEVERGEAAIIHQTTDQLEMHVLRTLTRKQRESAIRGVFLKFAGLNR